MPIRTILIFTLVAVHLSAAPLLDALKQFGTPAIRLDSEATDPNPERTADWMKLATNNLLVVGIADSSPLLRRTRGHTYGFNTASNELYRLGLGRFQGDIGCVETLFNPWLYSDRVDDAPKSTLLIRITATTQKGLKLALAAFEKGLNNGIVMPPDARRTETSILDLTPSQRPPPEVILKTIPPPKTYCYAGWTQCPAQEYRAWLDWGSAHEPQTIWRIKYLSPHALVSASGATWANSPLALAFGNAVTIARFDSEASASAAFAALQKQSGQTSGVLRFPYPKDEVDYGPGAIRVYRLGDAILMNSLPEGNP